MSAFEVFSRDDCWWSGDNRPSSIYCLGEMPIRCCGQSGASRGEVGTCFGPAETLTYPSPLTSNASNTSRTSSV